MKRLLIIFVTTFVALIANAEGIQLATEQFFDGRYEKEKTVSTCISRDNRSYYRMIQVKNNPAIMKKICEAVYKDKAKASKYFEQTDEEGKSLIISIDVSGGKIDIGFEQDPSEKSGSLFIKGPEKAFK